MSTTGREPGTGNKPGGNAPRGGHIRIRQAEKARDFKGTLKRLIGYLRPHRFALGAVLLMAVAGTVFDVAGPKVMGLATTRLFTDMMMRLQGVPGARVDFGYLLQILLILGGLYLLSAVFSYLQQYIMVPVSQAIVYEMRREIDDKLSRLPLKFFDARAHGDILSRVTNDIDNVSSTLQQGITQMIASVVTLVGITIMMLAISPLLTLICAVILPLGLLLTKTIISRSQKYFTEQRRELGKLNGHVGYERQAIDTFDGINERFYAAQWKSQFISGAIMPLMNFATNIVYVLVCVAGGIMAARKAMQIGDIQAFILYVRQFTQPVTYITNIVNTVQDTVASAERVFELLDETEEAPDSPAAVAIEFPRGAVAFQNVRFRYQSDVPLMEDLNIDVSQRQAIAVVGPTGAGKTTLVNLLMRFYEIGGGRITVDGVDIREMKRSSLRGLFGMVLQDTWLFNGTIKDNIAYGRQGATFEEIVQAAKAAHADHFIRTLPDGYDTVLNEDDI